MAEDISIVAQYAMDQFYQNYRSGTDFFELKDFVFHCGASLGAAFQAGYDQKYAELRQENMEEVVSFSHDWLLDQYLKVEHKGKETFAVLKQQPFSFPYDKQDCGVQELFSVEPYGTVLERSNITEVWQQPYYPATSHIFWWVDRTKIRFFNKGGCTVNEVRLLYVPTICDTMQVPDALVEMTVIDTVARIKQLAQGVVIKKSLDQNDNKVLQTELDAKQLKGLQR